MAWAPGCEGYSDACLSSLAELTKKHAYTKAAVYLLQSGLAAGSTSQGAPGNATGICLGKRP